MKLLMRPREDGFTLIEIMTVVIIISALSAVIFPTYQKHIRKGIHATLVSDVRNAAVEMDKFETFSKNGFPSSVPNTFTPSESNIVIIVLEQSSPTFYCLQGSNTTYPDMFVYYNSTTRKLITEGTLDRTNCGDNKTTNGNPPPGVVSPDTPTPPTPTSTPTPTDTPTTPPTTPAPEPTPTMPPLVPPTTPAPEPTPTTPTTPPTTPPSTNPPTTPPTTPPSTNPPTTPPTKPPTATDPDTETPPPNPPSFNNPNKGKYEVCHNGQMLLLPVSGILNGHDGHPLDIIPPIPGIYPGLNWTQANADKWYLGCDNKWNTNTAPPIKDYDKKNREKYDICHNGNMLSLPLSGILSGHSKHDDDIIPPIRVEYPEGLNWDMKGLTIWKNDCAGQKEYWDNKRNN